MKASELTIVFVSVAMFASGLLIGRNSVVEAAPAPEPVSFTMVLPKGLTNVSAPLIEVGCDRDPHVTLSGANINMHGNGGAAIQVDGPEEE